ncbi:hypothetical protein AB0F18_35365, partial [Streptomyces sp. NPDC029216]|uniref:hypothetical protein n=1 Tax=Streptomyces sp. NPDC029216 TaxID=3154701 RepID=UPI0033C54DA2
MTSPLLPPVAAEVVAEAVENLSARLRKKLDAAVEGCRDAAVAGPDGDVTVGFGEDAVVTLRPGPAGTLTEAGQAVCTCLLAPRCLHRAAVLAAAPLADPSPWPDEAEEAPPEPEAEPAHPHTAPGTENPPAGMDPAPAPGTPTGTAPTPDPAQDGSTAAPARKTAAGTASTPAGETAASAGTGAAAGAADAPRGAAAATGAENGSDAQTTGGTHAVGGSAAARPGATAPAGRIGSGAAPSGASAARGRAGGGAGSAAEGRAAASGGTAAGAGSAASGAADASGKADASGRADGAGSRPTAAQVRAGGSLWVAAAEALAAGVGAGGAVVQAELLRAAHTARVAGLPGAEAAALRVVRGLRAARERSAGQRLTDLAAAFEVLLRTSALLAAGTGGPGLTGSGRRAYGAGGSLAVHGLCREPVLTATGYGGVVTHLLGADGVPYTLSDVRPGGLARARGAGAASVALGGGALDHAALARGGLRIAGATVSADGRLGAGRGVRATPLPGVSWDRAPLAALFARPAAEAVAAMLAQDAEPGLLGCAVRVEGAAGDHVLVRELSPDGTVRVDAPLLRLFPAHPHPELAHTANLRRLAGWPGLAVRVVGRPDPDRAAVLRPLAVGPVPGAGYTLRLPPEWRDRADLGYDRLQQPAHPPQGRV